MNNDNFGSLIKELDLTFTHSLSLINGNIFIIHKNGVKVYNYNFTTILYSYDFGGIPIISSEKDNNFTSLIQCDDDNKRYIIAIIYNNIYIFSSRGQYLFHITNNNIFTDFSLNVIYQSYSFLYYKYEENIYYFIISFIDNQNFIKLKEFSINMETHIYQIIKNETYNIDNIISDSVSCQNTYINDYSNVLACFYARIIDSNKNFMLSIFNIENNFQLLNETSLFQNMQNENYLIKSIKGKEKRKALIIFKAPALIQLCWFIFDFDLFINNNFMYAYDCKSGNDLININYFDYTNHYFFSCITDSGFSITKVSIDSSISNIIYLNDNIEIGNNFTNFINYEIIFLPYAGKYYIISNFICQNSNTQLFSLPWNLALENQNYIFPTDLPDSFSFSSNYTVTTTPIYTTIPIETTIMTTILTTIITTFPTTIITILLQIYLRLKQFLLQHF